jgi:hypothetical protein
MNSAQKFLLACLSRTSYSACRAFENILRTSANILRMRMDATTDTIHRAIDFLSKPDPMAPQRASIKIEDGGQPLPEVAMRLVKSVLVIAVVTLVGLRCSGSLEPGWIAGKWAEDFAVPAGWVEMTLRTSGNNVTGSGSACGEAGTCGTFTVTGTIDGGTVHLEMGSTEHFDGTLQPSGALQGPATFNISGQPPVVENLSFHRG